MDIFAIRLQNFRALVEAMQAPQGSRGKRKSQRAVALALDMSPSYLSQLVKGKKMGEDVARKVEKLRSLNHGALDRLPASGSATGVVSVSQKTGLDPRIIASSIKFLRQTFAANGKEFDPERDADLIAELYAVLADPEGAVDPTNLIDFGRRLAERRVFGSGERDGKQDGGAGGTDRAKDPKRAGKAAAKGR